MNKIRHMYGEVYKIEGYLYDKTLLVHFHYTHQLGKLSLQLANYVKITGTFQECITLQNMVCEYYRQNPAHIQRVNIIGGL